MDLENISKMCNTNKLFELEKIEKEEREKFEKAFEDETWLSVVKGRDILKALSRDLSSENNRGISYEILRNTIISFMASDNHKPEGMIKVIQEITNA